MNDRPHFYMRCKSRPSLPAGSAAPMAVVTGGLCTSSRKEGGKTPREKEGHKPPFEAQFSAFWHPLMLLCQDGQRMAHAGLNATQTGLPSLPSTHSSCNGKILILTTEKWNPKCPTFKVFPKDMWRKSWRNCHLVTINRLGTRVTARNRNLDSGFIQMEEIPAEVVPHPPGIKRSSQYPPPGRLNTVRCKISGAEEKVTKKSCLYPMTLYAKCINISREGR